MTTDCLGREIKIGHYVAMAGKRHGCGSSGYRPLKLYFGIVTRMSKSGGPMAKFQGKSKEVALATEHTMIVPGWPISTKFPEFNELSDKIHNSDHARIYQLPDEYPEVKETEPYDPVEHGF